MIPFLTENGGQLSIDGWLPHGGWTTNLLYVVLFCLLVDFVKLVVELLGRGENRKFGSDPARLSAIVPSRNGAQVIGATIRELSQLLDPERILVVDDASMDGTGAVAANMGCKVFRFEKRKGKAAGINMAVHHVTTPYVLILDDDTRLGGLRIPTSLLSEDGYDAVAFHVLPDRRSRDGSRGDNFIGALQRYEYGKSMAIGRRFHDVTQSVSCVSGAVGLFRTADLDAFHHDHTGVFQGEDLQRTMIHLLRGKRVVFADQPAWTVAPSSWRQWFSQRLWGWYPGLYHQIRNFLRLLVRPRAPWRLRYEVTYNLYTFVSDPLKTWSILVLAFTPGLRVWLLVIYFAYLLFEIYPYAAVKVPGEKGRAPITVLFFYPIYGGINTVLRMLSALTWFWMRFITGDMRPRRGPKDRIV